MGPDDVRRGRAVLGRRLATLRDAAGYTQKTFAPLTNYGRSTIANVETGGQRAPRTFWQHCDELLNTGGVLTAHYDQVEALTQQLHAQKTLQRYPRQPTAAHSQHIAPGDTTFVGPADSAYVGLEQAIMIAARQSSEHAMDAGAWAVSETTIEQLRDDATDIARRFGLLTPAAAVSETLRVRDLAVAGLQRTRRPGQQADLYLITAQAVALLASASADLGLWSSAMQYARAAATYGEVIGHAGVRAYARGMQATVAYWTGHPVEAVQYALEAVDLAPAGVAQVRAQCVLARAWSHRGADEEVESALTAADQARSGDGEDVLHDVIGGEFGFTASQQARCASTAWLQADRPQEATIAAATALDLATAHSAAPWLTVEAEARVDLGTCQLLSGQLGAARETLTPLWPMPPDWRRTGLLGRLRRVQSLLAADKWRGVPEAQQLAELVESFSASRQEPPALPSPDSD